MAGRLEEHTFVSDALRGNPLGDPHARPLWVWLPPEYDDDEARRWPSVYVIQGLTGQLEMWRNVARVQAELPRARGGARAAAASSSGSTPGRRTAAASSSTRRRPATTTRTSATRSCPWVDERYRTAASAANRGIQGKSSGGYGAMITPLLRPDLFGGLATHAGDALFEHCYLPDFRVAARALRDSYDGSFDRFWEDFHSRPPFSKGTDHALLNTWCMAACYSARPGRHGRGAVRHRDRRARRRGLGRVARVGPGADGPQAARRRRRAARRLDRLRPQRRVLPRPRRARRSTARSSPRACGRSTSSSSRASTAASTGATRSRSAGSPSGSSPDATPAPDRDQPRRARGRRPRRGARVVRALPRLPAPGADPRDGVHRPGRPVPRDRRGPPPAAGRPPPLRPRRRRQGGPAGGDGGGG